MPSTPLSRLEKIDLRQAWATEAGDFTPWLAMKENLALLGDTIDLELELEAQEKSVGPFRADILCKDTTTDDWVLIENQLEKTDHTHLGQLLTYGAGLKAVTIVWIANRFTEEHRAALDWLNAITDDRFNFFGLEVELWRIANSPIAPKFNVVCKPNDWSRTVAGAASRIEEGGLSETKLLQREYWAALREVFYARKSIIRPQKPHPQSWTSFAIGRSKFALGASMNTQKGFIQAHFNCYGTDAKAHFFLLQDQRDEIENEVGFPLEWEELPGKKESRVSVRQHSIDPTNQDAWQEQHDWLADCLDKLHKAFAQRVKVLDASEWIPDEAPQSI
jgi:Domain of unknown function (DUF4268)